MSEMIAGGAFQAISGRRRKLEGESSWSFMSLNNACWCSSRWMSVSLGSAQVLACAGDGERLLAVDVVGASAQAQGEAAVGRAAVELGDDAAAAIGDPAHRVDQLREVFEVDFHHMVDRDVEPVLDHRYRLVPARRTRAPR